MQRFHARLIDPSPGEVADRLADAAKAANGSDRDRLLDPNDKALWRKYAQRMAVSAEGRVYHKKGKFGTPTSIVGLGWWTDIIGRKHVVLRGRRVYVGDQPAWTERHPLTTRTGLWHCYPDRVCVRYVGGRAEAFAVCDCGVAGHPAALGWMGECCGPCYDRRQELHPNTNPDIPSGRATFHGRPVYAVAIGTAGKWVAVLTPDGDRFQLQAVRVSDGKVIGYRSDRLDPRSPVAVVGDRYVVFVGEHSGTRAVWYDLDDDSGMWTYLPGDEHVFGVVPTAGDEFAVHEPTGVRVVGLPDGRTRRILHPTPPGITHTPLRPAAGWQHAVGVYPSGVRRVDFTAGLIRAVTPYPDVMARTFYDSIGSAYDADRNILTLGYDGGLVQVDPENGNVIGRVERPLSAFRAVHYGPGRRHLWAIDSKGDLHAFDAESLRAIGRYEWHIGPIAASAVTPDGRTLLTGGADGLVKLWPLDRLLDGLPD